MRRKIHFSPRCPEVITEGYYIDAVCGASIQDGKALRCDREYGGKCEWYESWKKDQETIQVRG